MKRKNREGDREREREIDRERSMILIKPAGRAGRTRSVKAAKRHCRSVQRTYQR